jgi:hypothetical protein
MQFDYRAWEHLESVKQGYRRKTESRRVDDDASSIIDCLVNPVDQLFLTVRLVKNQRMLTRGLAAAVFYLP